MKRFPYRQTVSELAQFYGATRPTIYRAIEAAGLNPDKKGRYSSHKFDFAVERHCPRILDDRPDAPATLWRNYFNADFAMLRARIALERAGWRTDRTPPDVVRGQDDEP